MRKKISDYWLKKIILHFCVDIEASKAAILIGLNRNTINSYYNHFRRLIALHQESILQSELDKKGSPEPTLSVVQTAGLNKGKIDFKKLGQYPVYGLFEQDGHVFADVIHPIIITQMLAVIRDKKSAEIHVGKGFRYNYDALLYGMFPRLAFLSYNKDSQSGLSGNSFTIESFWSFCCRRLYKFNGISRHFYLHLKECEWRWKRSEKELAEQLQKMIL